MLTIVDLHQEQELSASTMGNVAGGSVDTFLDISAPVSTMEAGTSITSVVTPVVPIARPTGKSPLVYLRYTMTNVA
jgi:hypothetical protein